MAMRISRLQRILRLLSVLQSKRLHTPDELARRLEISRRTVFRDLESLRKAGIPYCHDEKRGGYRLISDGFLLPPLNLNLSESLALLLVTSNTDNIMSEPFGCHIQRAAMKIESALPSHIQRHCGVVIRNTSIQQGRRPSKANAPENFSTLRHAIANSQKVEILYESFYERQSITTILSPYHLHFANSGWYVMGHSSFHRQVRTFNIARIRAIKLLKSLYLLDRPFGIDQYLGLAWSLIPEGRLYDIKLRFKPMVASNVAETLWHSTQKLSWRSDRQLDFEVCVDGLGEIVWWILGYGDQVEVLSPVELRDKLSAMAAGIVSLYRGKSTVSDTGVLPAAAPVGDSHSGSGTARCSPTS